MKATVRQLLLRAILPAAIGSYGPPAVAAFDDSRGLFPPAEPSRWSVAFENDLLAQPASDEDYTFGMSFSFSDSGLDEHWSNAALRAIDDSLGPLVRIKRRTCGPECGLGWIEYRAQTGLNL